MCCLAIIKKAKLPNGVVWPFLMGGREMQFISRILIFCIGIFLFSIQAQAAFFKGLGVNNYAENISLDGSTVVGLSNSAPESTAFIWDSTNGIRNLKEVLTNEYGLDMTGWNLTAAWDVSDSGETIVGEGYDPYGNHTAWIASIREQTRIYGEFSGHFDRVEGTEDFKNEIEVGTEFIGTFSYNTDMPIIRDDGDTIYYRDESFSIEYTFFGNTQEHNLRGSGADIIGFSDNDTSYGNDFWAWIDGGWSGSLAGYLPVEGFLEFNYSSGTGSINFVIAMNGLNDDISGIIDSFTAYSDNCPNDPNKIDPGICGCGVPDTDNDGDGTVDCVDDCPNDPGKTDPGTCGCGVADVDTDSDGTFDCKDNCPNDPNKINPGVCGCGIADTDSDGDGILDCNDNCDNSIDTDGDGLSDCDDLCPNDSNKTQPGTCGCGVADTDTDLDGTLDCNDDCPNDSNKTQPGACGCGIADTDTDLDGTPDCTDGCANDINKTQPGTCGCGIPDTDSDGDGIPDCNDNCDNSIDSDGDGINDCDDLCPKDPNKTVPGTCGCGIADSDSDGDGTLDCKDVNDDGDGLPDGEEQGPDRNNPNYDGNGDGIADYLQGNVASFHTYNNQNYITIASPSGTTIRNCKAVNKPSVSNSPQNVDFAHGFFGFSIDGTDPGGASTATMYFPAGETFNTYYKYGPTPDNPINHWYEFLHEGQTGANFNGNVITLHFVDGIRGDDDLTTNGIISDIGAPGVILDSGDGGGNGSQVVGGSGGGGGGCFISTSNQ